MRRDLESDKVLNHTKVVFLSHSIRGLVTREFLLKYKDYSDKVSFLYFFSTPTSRSPIATLAKMLSRNPQLGVMIPLKSDTYLADIQRNWLASQQMTEIPSYGAYEKKDTFGFLIVEQQSATHLCNRRVDPIDKNHIDIVKPANISDGPYRAFKDAYLNASFDTKQPNISCFMEYPIKVEKDNVYRDTKNLNLIIKNSGPIPAVSVSAKVDIFTYNQ
jgi:hypothetical protein